MVVVPVMNGGHMRLLGRSLRLGSHARRVRIEGSGVRGPRLVEPCRCAVRFHIMMVDVHYAESAGGLPAAVSSWSLLEQISR